ncbi:MAG TPA: DUF308 domain-containing protein [Ktedonobacteraceae bacterium]|jgi:uncharacterized membrane protein HdeD (DUF308 family)
MASDTTNNMAFAASVSPVPWWSVLLEGIFAMLMGFLLFAAPGMTSVFLVTVLGIYLLIRGVIALVQIFTGSTRLPWGWLLFSGIVGVIAGLAILRHPLYATVLTGSVLVIIVAVAALVMGAGGVVQAFMGGGWSIGILSALSILISLFLFANLFVVTAALPFIIAGLMVIGGIVAIVFSFGLRKA